MKINEIEKKLLFLNRKQRIHFSWICSIRALPYLVKLDKPFVLKYSFILLDHNIYSGFIQEKYSGRVEDYLLNEIKGHNNFACDTIICASEVLYAASANNAYKTSLNLLKIDRHFLDIIFSDIDSVVHQTQFIYNIEIYDEIWIDFVNYLSRENLNYWYKWICNIFNNNLDIKVDFDLQNRIKLISQILPLSPVETSIFYEEHVKKELKDLNEGRIIILGDKGAGKTSLAKKLIDIESDITLNRSTIGVDIPIWEIDDYRVRIWDFAGHVDTHATHHLFLSENCLYIIVYNGRTERGNNLEYWLEHVKNYGGNSEIIILVNVFDENRVTIPVNNLKKKYNIKGVSYFSLLSDKNQTIEFRNDILERFKSNLSWNKKSITLNFYRIKEKMEKLFDEGVDDIEICQLKELARLYGVNDFDILLKNLHCLGVGLHYDISGIDAVILNPEWITSGVYYIINWMSNNEKHSIKISEIAHVFKNKTNSYPTSKHEFLYKLMIKYELAYEMKAEKILGSNYEKKAEKGLEVPCLLDIDQPEYLPNFFHKSTIMFRFSSESPLPPDTISRFIVRHNGIITRYVWRYGAILRNHDGTTALVIEEDRAIQIFVAGSIIDDNFKIKNEIDTSNKEFKLDFVTNEQKTEFLSEIRKSLNDIFKSYKQTKRIIEYNIHIGSLSEDEIIWVSEVELDGHAKHCRNYWDSTSDREFSISELIKTFNLEAEFRYK